MSARRRARTYAHSLTAAFTFLLLAQSAHAQEADAGAPEPPAAEAEAAPAAAPDLNALAKDLAETKKQVEDQQKQLDEQQKQLDEAQKTGGEAVAPKEEILRVYGFAEAGYQRIWAHKGSPLTVFNNAINAGSFVLGNLDFYVDIHPLKDWRSLIELRVSNAPGGQITSFGGLGGRYSELSTVYEDPNAPTPLAKMWGATTVIERAQIDWTPTQLFKVRTGYFFTPFGIYNVDHGAPTLITVGVPTFMAYQIIPQRQMGVMVYGNAFKGNWELGYHATVSNGRQTVTNFALDDSRALGGRLYANLEKDGTVFKLGVSGFTGSTRNRVVDIVSANPVRFNDYSTYEYREWLLGADASLDIDRTRFRLEGFLRKVDHEPGKHEPQDKSGRSFQPNRYEQGAFAIAAHQLPWAGLEPYLAGEIAHLPTGVGDLVVTPSAGLNIRFNASVMLKTQVMRRMFFDIQDEGIVTARPAFSNTTDFYSRLVLVF